MTIRRATERAARAALVLLAAALAACGQREPTGVALIGVTVVDGSGGPPQPGMVVVTRGSRIEAIVPATRFELPARTREVDLSGRWVVPGLVDAHAHAAPWALERYLAHGVTTVRDVHGALDSALALRDRLNLNAIAGPRVYSAGAMIDARPTTYPDAIGVTNETEARKGVDRLAVANADLVKTYTRITPELLRAVTDEAAAFRLRVTSHLGLTDAVTAAGLGVTGIEHLSGVPEAAAADASPFYAAHRASFFAGWTYFERSWAGLDSAALERVARALAERKTTLVPTLALHEIFSRLDRPEAQQDPDLQVVPEAEMTRWNTPDMVRRAGWTAADFEAFRRGRAKQDLFVRRFVAAGGRVAAGTDAANQMLVPGASMHRELALLVGAGLTPAQAIAAATSGGAALLGVDSIGTLAPGKVADLVVLRRSPYQNIENTRLIQHVMQRGLLLSGDSLRTRIIAK